MEFFFGLLVILGLLGAAIYLVLTNLIYICSPNEVLVFSGSRRRTRSGSDVGYRVVKGGRSLRVPFLESVDRLDLTNMNIDVSVYGAFAKGGIPVNIEGIANVKIAGESPALDNALQRLLGKSRKQIMRIAKATLEGYLRGVLATLTPQEANEDTQTFERELRDQASEGFERLGLTLDNLKIQAINDEEGYLAAVGRVSAAELNRDNRIAEAERRSEARIQQAEARRRGELAKIQAALKVAEAETARRVRDAETSQTAYVAEQEGQVKALLTRARAEVGLQEARVEQIRSQLVAEVVTPARAGMEARIAEARGDAAPILETGRAQAEALTALAHQWKEAGSEARDIFLLQKLEAILPTFLSSIRDVKVNELTMIQAGSEGGSSLPSGVVATVKALEAAGVDVGGLVGRLGSTASSVQNTLEQGSLKEAAPVHRRSVGKHRGTQPA
ncbi:MAG: flotillin family protein [Planctomycetota bacterium]